MPAPHLLIPFLTHITRIAALRFHARPNNSQHMSARPACVCVQLVAVGTGFVIFDRLALETAAASTRFAFLVVCSPAAWPYLRLACQPSTAGCTSTRLPCPVCPIASLPACGQPTSEPEHARRARPGEELKDFAQTRPVACTSLAWHPQSKAPEPAGQPPAALLTCLRPGSGTRCLSADLWLAELLAHRPTSPPACQPSGFAGEACRPVGSLAPSCGSAQVLAAGWEDGAITLQGPESGSTREDREAPACPRAPDRIAKQTPGLYTAGAKDPASTGMQMCFAMDRSAQFWRVSGGCAQPPT